MSSSSTAKKLGLLDRRITEIFSGENLFRSLTNYAVTMYATVIAKVVRHRGELAPSSSLSHLLPQLIYLFSNPRALLYVPRF